MFMSNILSMSDMNHSVYYKHCRYNTVVIKYTTTNITDWIVVVKGVSPSNNDLL